MFLRILILFPLLLPSMVSGIKSSSRWWTLKRFRTLKKDVKYIKEQIGSMSEMDKTLFNKITEDSKKMTEINETLFQIKETVEKLGSGQTEIPKRKPTYYNMSPDG